VVGIQDLEINQSLKVTISFEKRKKKTLCVCNIYRYTLAVESGLKKYSILL